MVNKKFCVWVKQKNSKNYWDGPKNMGTVDKFIPGRWTKMAKQLIKTYNLNNKSKILDVGSSRDFTL